MPRKWRFSKPSEAEPNAEEPTEDNTKTCHLSGAPSEHVSHPESSSDSGAHARHSDIRPFRPPRDKASSDPSDSVEHRHPPERCPIHMNQDVVDNIDTEDKDCVLDADEMESFDDDINNLFANHDAEEQNKGKKRKDIDWWDVEVIGRKIVLKFNESHQVLADGGGLLSGYLGGLGADFKKFPISLKSWHKMKKYKESVYNDFIKRTFHFEDSKGKIKKDILKRLEKLWKDSRSNLLHTFDDDDTKSIDENVKKHKPRGVDPEHWRFFFKYRLSEETQCKKNIENRSKQVHTHTGRSMTLARRREEEEAIQVIESCDQSTNELSQNDSLAQVLRKEHLGCVRGMGARPCPTQIIKHGTQHTSFASYVDVDEYKREIVELKAEAAEEKKKRQSMEHIVRYLLQ
ncbi:hypothetical protein PIB30_038447 [Stylosanthes scabra]|uniref:Uncharacterized protein n=1 Tax=Stylosanthes scabra TaxID=79078 RepID=A0ABU6XCH8_9FABA|nr:hypothetical protein [Stylosanthes scabra]